MQTIFSTKLPAYHSSLPIFIASESSQLKMALIRLSFMAFLIITLLAVSSASDYNGYNPSPAYKTPSYTPSPEYAKPKDHPAPKYLSLIHI